MTGTNKLIGLNITGAIVPCTEEDTYATHDSKYGKGGWREVETLAERNAIPAERRRIGMVVFVKEDFTNYQLKGTASNDGWVVFGSSDADGKLTEAVNEMGRRVDAMTQTVSDIKEQFDNKADKVVVDQKFSDLNDIIDTLETKVEGATHLKEEDLAPYLKIADADTKFATKEELAKKIDSEAAHQAFATKEELDKYVSDEEIKAYAKKTDLEALATKEEVTTALADKADKTELADYVKNSELIEKTEGYIDEDELKAALEPYVKADSLATNLEPYAKKTDLDTYAKTEVLNQYVKNEALDNYVTNEKLEQNYVSNTDLNTKVEKIIGTYTAPEIIEFKPTVSVFEKGSKATFTLNWTLNKEVTYQTVASIGEIEVAPSERSLLVENVLTDTDYMLRVDDGSKQATALARILFNPARYYGVSAKETLTAEDILALNKDLVDSRGQTRIFDCSEGAYFYIVIQEKLVDDSILFKVGGNILSAIEEETIDLTNEYGYQARYKVFRSSNLMTGSKIPVEVL